MAIGNNTRNDWGEKTQIIEGNTTENPTDYYFFEAMASRNVKETRVYKLAFETAMEIFDISKKFPKEETYSLTDQIRRSSRSVCICLLEAYRKKRYPAHFVAKVTDSDMENSETSVWLDFAKQCKYLEIGVHRNLSQKRRSGKIIKSHD